MLPNEVLWAVRQVLEETNQTEFDVNLQARAKQFWQAMKFLGLHLNEKENFTSIVTPYLFRSYHNLNHIERCLIELESFDLDDLERSLLIISIWFHDIIYDTQRTDNEIQSAVYFVQNIIDHSSRKSLEESKKIFDIILATQYRYEDKNRNFSKLEQIMREIDLCGLLDTTHLLFETDKLIREEYKHVEEEIWKRNRIAFLRTLAQSNPFKEDKKNRLLLYNIEELISGRYS